MSDNRGEADLGWSGLVTPLLDPDPSLVESQCRIAQPLTSLSPICYAVSPARGSGCKSIN